MNDASNDIDDVCAGIAVRTFQYPHEFTEYDGGDDDHVAAFEDFRSLECLLLRIPRQKADKNICIYRNFHLSSPASIASCISCNEITR